MKLTPEEIEGDSETIPIDWPGLSSLREDELVYLADGAIRLRVSEPETDSEGVGCEVEVGGTLSSHKGMNVPGATAQATTDGDLGWVEFAVEHGIDLLAVSFVSTAADLVPAAERLRSLDSDIPLIAKIEKRQAAAELRGDHRGRDRRDHGRPWRPRDRAAAGRSPGRPETSDPGRRPPLEAGDHCDPDAGLDGDRATADPGRGDRRRQRDLRRHRRGDALRGDRGRRATRSRRSG